MQAKVARIRLACGLHHEIYLGDPRRANPSKHKTILRHPVKYLRQSLKFYGFHIFFKRQEHIQENVYPQVCGQRQAFRQAQDHRLQVALRVSLEAGTGMVIIETASEVSVSTSSKLTRCSSA